MELRWRLTLDSAGRHHQWLTVVAAAVVVVHDIVHAAVPVANVAIGVWRAFGGALGQTLHNSDGVAWGVICGRARLPSARVEHIDGELGEGRRLVDAFLPHRPHSCKAL